MAQPGYTGAPMGMPMEHPKLRSVKSLLDISRVVTLLFIVVNLLAAAWYIYLSVRFNGFTLFEGVFELVSAVVLLVMFNRIREVQVLTTAGRFAEAKDHLLVWAVLGLIFGYIILGILLLVAYMDLDPLIAAQQQSAMGGSPPGWGQPVPAQAWPGGPTASPAPAASPPIAPAAPAAPTCPQCHQPATWIAQYGRWYCYTDRQYL